MNDELERYQLRIIDILRRDYFSSEEGWELRPIDVRKNNDVKLKGIAIGDRNVSVSQTFYVNNFYEHGYTEEATANEIYENFEKSKNDYDEMKKRSFSEIFDFEKVKEKICYKLVNAQMNSEYLQNAPHIKITDELALCFYIQYMPEASIAIDERYAKCWKLDEERVAEQLYIIAEKNTKRMNPPVLENMTCILNDFDVIEEILEDADAEEKAAFEAVKRMTERSCPMYILSNEKKVFGASVLAYNDGQVLEDCRQAIERRTGSEVASLVIIPSSIHEIIVMPARDVENLNELKQMVMEVNATDVAVQERLSNNVFGYSPTEGFRQLTFDNRVIER